MKKKTLRLNEIQLRSLINEAIMSRSPGDPLWSPPSHSVATEAVTSGRRPPGGPVGNIDLHVIRDQWAEEMKMRYDEGDPSMEHLGQAAWDAQVEDAASELYDEFERVLNDVEQKLTEGEYYDKHRYGGPPKFGGR